MTRILHIDDDPAHLTFFEAMFEDLLRDTRVEFRQTSDPFEGRRLIDTWLAAHDEPSLVFCDHVMPGLLGADLLRDAIASGLPPQVHLYLLTGYLKDPAIQAAIDAGVQGAIDKGFRWDDVAQDLACAIEAHLGVLAAVTP